MFGLLQPKLPVAAEEAEWANRSFQRLAEMLGPQRMLLAKVVLPNDEYFPDRYDRSEQALRAIFVRVAKMMAVQSDEIDVSVYDQDHDLTRSLVPFYSGRASGAAGLYHHGPSGRTQISIDQEKLKDPMSLVATLAHELGHVILLRPGLVGRDEPDMEPLNDMLTIFLGLGIFTANAAFQYRQFTEDRSQGWSVHRQGYLSEGMFGYALARFAFERNEPKPAWAKYLASNIQGHFRRSQNWLRENARPLFDSAG
jgi:hypothetical protein